MNKKFAFYLIFFLFTFDLFAKNLNFVNYNGLKRIEQINKADNPNNDGQTTSAYNNSNDKVYNDCVFNSSNRLTIYSGSLPYNDCVDALLAYWEVLQENSSIFFNSLYQIIRQNKIQSNYITKDNFLIYLTIEEYSSYQKVLQEYWDSCSKAYEVLCKSWEKIYYTAASGAIKGLNAKGESSNSEYLCGDHNKVPLQKQENDLRYPYTQPYDKAANGLGEGYDSNDSSSPEITDSKEYSVKQNPFLQKLNELDDTLPSSKSFWPDVQNKNNGSNIEIDWGGSISPFSDESDELGNLSDEIYEWNSKNKEMENSLFSRPYFKKNTLLTLRQKPAEKNDVDKEVKSQKNNVIDKDNNDEPVLVGTKRKDSSFDIKNKNRVVKKIKPNLKIFIEDSNMFK